nr:23S rRNA (pseudouridine(1915)-N(3))-methyltransferase RlmH [Pseudomonas aeruginosa]
MEFNDTQAGRESPGRGSIPGGPLRAGGPDGRAPAVGARRAQRGARSPWTLPHPWGRILVGEQIYRAGT